MVWINLRQTTKNLRQAFPSLRQKSVIKMRESNQWAFFFLRQKPCRFSDTCVSASLKSEQNYEIMFQVLLDLRNCKGSIEPVR